MSEQAEEGATQNGETDENDQIQNEEESQAENPNAIQSLQDAASNLLGDGGEEDNPENKEHAKKKRRIKKRVRVKKNKDDTKNTEEEEGNEKNGEEEEKKVSEEEENANEYGYEYQYDYEYYSDDEEKKDSKLSKRKNRRYPDRPDHLSLSDSITHLDVPYDASTSSPHSRSPRKKNNTSIYTKF